MSARKAAGRRPSAETKPATPGAMTDAGKERNLEMFIRDIEPFFYRRSVTYVDVGAYDGGVFSQFLASRISIAEAHLIEPNPQSFAELQAATAEASRKRTLKLHNLALGDRRTQLRMRADRKMTRVIGDAAVPAGSETDAFIAESATLDTMADQIRNRRISILKIDVEGFEDKVLKGGGEFLKDQRVDVIYIEAGADPAGTQQCYYRIIEDLLRGHGYRLFRIYEQTNEWQEDSPFLRRMNLAYMSETFAKSHPLRLTKELFAQQEKNSGLEAELNASKAASAELVKRVAELELHAAELNTRLDTLLRERESTNADLEDLERRRALESSQFADRLREAAEARSESKRLQTLLSRQETATQSLRQALSAARGEMRLLRAAAKEQVRDARAEVANAAAAKLVAAAERAEQLRAALANAKAEPAQARAAIKERILQARAEGAGASAAKLAAAAERTEQLKVALAAAKAEIAQIRAAAREEIRGARASAAAACAAKLAAAAEQAEARLLRAVEKREALLGKLVASAQAARESAGGRIRELRREVSRLLKKVAADAERIKELQTELAAAQTTAATTALQLEETQLNARTAEQEHQERSTGQLTQIRRLREELERTKATAAAEASALCRRIDEVESDADVLAAELSAVRQSRGYRIETGIRKIARPFLRKPSESQAKHEDVQTSRPAPPEAPLIAASPPAPITRPDVASAPLCPPAEPTAVPIVDEATLPPIPSPVTPPRGRRSRELEDKLWGGFAGQALHDLEALRTSKETERREAGAAALALAGWHAAEGDVRSALDLLRESAGARPKARRSRPSILLEAYCLVRMGENDMARELVQRALEEHPDDIDLRLAMANTYAAPPGVLDPDGEEVRLSWINGVYAAAGLGSIAKADPLRPLAVDNLAPAAPLDWTAGDQARISVILPVYNAERTLGFTLEGLLAQTWRNLEIIPVDDCSTDGTFALIEAFAARDDRILPVRQDINRGSYSARNKALTIATGDFLTIHDANDWSHPQKLEIQARRLLQNDNAIANHSKWARVLENMVFVGKYRRKDKICDWNPSSFFFRRELLEKVGGWDRVRISADAELIRRSKLCWPDREIGSAFEAAPLAFAYDTEGSLTKHGATHGRTIFHGFRREYREASDFWHANATVEELRLDAAQEQRPFPVAGPLLPLKEQTAAADLLLIADFNLPGSGGAELADRVQTALGSGARVALFHWPLYDSDVAAPLAPYFRGLAHKGSLRILAPGERADVQSVHVLTPEVLEHPIDLFPTLNCRQLFVAAEAGEISETALKTLEKLFGREAVWDPAPPLPAAGVEPPTPVKTPASQLERTGAQP